MLIADSYLLLSSMAKIPKSTRNSSCFPAFFHSSGKFSAKRSSDDRRSDNRENNSCFSWSRFRVKKSAAKTVPVDAAVQEKAKRTGEIQPEIPEKFYSGAGHGAPVASEKAAKTRYGTAQNIPLENRKDLDRLDSSKGATCLKKRKLECKRSRSSHLDSPVNMSVTTRPAGPIARSISFPVPRPQKQAALRVEKSPTKGKLAEKADSVVAMTIIMVTLAIVVIYGRLCAILCTCAWFYFIRYLRSDSKPNEILNSEFDDRNSNSEEMKKKVIFEGFLERNHRHPVGIL